MGALLDGGGHVCGSTMDPENAAPRRIKVNVLPLYTLISGL